MHDFTEQEAKDILLWIEPAISTLAVNLSYLLEEFERNDLETTRLKGLIEIIENMEYLDEYEDFTKLFNNFKSSMSLVINQLFSKENDYNLYEIYSYLYTIDNMIVALNDWIASSTTNVINKKMVIRKNDIKNFIKVSSQEDFDEFGKIATEFQLLGKDEQKLFNVLIVEDDWKDLEEGLNIFIELYEIAHPLSFLSKTSREVQNIETTSYYLLIRILTLVTFYNYWTENELQEGEELFDDEILEEMTFDPNPEFDKKSLFGDFAKLEVQLDELPEYQPDPIKVSDEVVEVDNVSELVNDLELIRKKRFQK
ncbi:hypothetical protein SSABA_v1c04540 [Spiroplasma sabaudiense Ar-1343]|uniref:Uncharacterized protein n=1 Tax=Spiroplasma sabaudiense Ar-1343 TaxID=1276257 RepID=W6AA33_9MOLU|nr:hypothetical protein [Spiroplasma sabaudiense]AHI53861.1 hypothetical protein SSABA_v1c04540 [Spiroplasma sabaudiense Ar-1343]